MVSMQCDKYECASNFTLMNPQLSGTWLKANK